MANLSVLKNVQFRWTEPQRCSENEPSSSTLLKSPLPHHVHQKASLKIATYKMPALTCIHICIMVPQVAEDPGALLFEHLVIFDICIWVDVAFLASRGGGMNASHQYYRTWLSFLCGHTIPEGGWIEPTEGIVASCYGQVVFNPKSHSRVKCLKQTHRLQF